MTAPVIYRAAFDALEIRSGGDGRTIVGRAVPYDAWTRIRDADGEYDERFLHGAFSRSLEQRASKIPLRAKHNEQALPLGPIRKFDERADGLWISARVSRTGAGDEILELVNDEVLNGLSVGFSPIRQEWTDRRSKRTHTESRLHEVSLCEEGAYAGALVTGVRSLDVPTLGPSLDFYDRELWLAQEHTR
jgi:phage prohead protease, HK97 family